VPKSLLLLSLAALCLAGGAAGADPDYELVFSDDADSVQLFVVDRDCGPPRQLTSGLVNRLQPASSPDGSSIAYVRYVEGEWRLFLVDADGTKDRPLTKRSRLRAGIAPSWSPDARSVVFQRDGELYVVEVATAAERRLTYTFGDDRAPAWAPDSSRIALGGDNGLSVINAELTFAVDDHFVRDSRTRFFVVAAGGGAPRAVTIGAFPDWRRTVGG